ncbi:MAG TPA: VWA domain-containing protein [Anaerolineae bacterium]|nr:VWA domain-containing protein [Anaerolineae bacterium]HRA18892.1 VWA domain-containing protein [Anaerolineae bacterium]
MTFIPTPALVAGRPAIRRPLVAALAFAVLSLALLLPGGRSAAARQPEGAAATDQNPLLAYQMVAQWPERSDAAQGLFQSPSDLDMTRDGTVFIADPGVGGIHRLLPTGEWAAPFGVTGGFPAQLGRVGDITVGPDPNVPGFPYSAERVYVLDTAADRVAIYSPDGSFQTAWTGIKGQGIAAGGMDTRVYVLDKETSEVLALDPRSGAQTFKFGMRGTDDGQFSSFTDVDVSGDGKVIAIGDKRGGRVQIFDLATDEQLAADPALPAATLRKVYDLTDARFTQGDFSCDASRINSLGGDKVFVGEGNGACVIDGRNVSFAIAASAVKGSICKATVTLPRLKAMTQTYYALAVSDPNVGKCGAKRADLDTSPVVVEYGDEQLKQVDTVFTAASNENSDSPLLFAPEALSMPEPGVVFIADSSSQFRYFSDQGEQVATAERSSQSGSFGGDFTFFQLITADGSDVRGEVQGYYLKGQRVGQEFKVEGGLGRFKTVEKRGQGGLERVIEPIWTDALISSFNEIEIPALAYNRVTNEFLAVQAEAIPQQRSQDVKLVRYAADGRKLKPDWDLPDDGKTNPYVDMAVAPDGRVLLLDDLNDRVRIYSPAGQELVQVPVSYDARSLAGGPEDPKGSVFVLREPGAIERVADDGTVTARLDARPLPFSDPTTLTDLVVDAAGRVYVADGQSSLISVFQTAEAGDQIPVPNDGECLFKGTSGAAPAQLQLGQSTDLSLKLEGRCGVLEPPTDIVVVVPYFETLQQGQDPSTVTVNELTQLMSRLNFGRHRVGIVSYYSTYATELPLTASRDAYNQKVRDITRFDRSNPAIKPRLRDALEEAAKLFAGSGDRRKVAVLLRAEYCTTDFEFFPGQCTGIPAAEDAALALRQLGVTIVVVNSGPAPAALASSDEDYLYGAPAVHRRMVRYAPPPTLAQNLTLTAAMPATIAVDPAGISGGGSWVAPDILWQLPSLGFDGLTAGARLEPRAAGRVKLGDRIQAVFTDGWGKAQTVDFAIPEVEVIGPTATPVPASPTPAATATTVPPTATTQPTATPAPQAIYLPWASNNLCFPVKKRFDIVVVLDVSSSMRTDGRLETAKAAIASLLDNVKLGAETDHVALVTFATDARVVLGFSADRAAIDAAKAGIGLREGTRIDRGLTAALDLLSGPEARESAGKVVVLLSDGEQKEQPELALAAGETARAGGAQVYTIGFGGEADAALLRAVATDPSRYFSALSGADLSTVYARIAASIPGCP